MKNTGKYNGWANYETWCVNLWCENEYRISYADFLTDEQIDEYKVISESARFVLRSRLADSLEKNFSNWLDEKEIHGVFGDLLGAALASVDWYEIACAWLEKLEV